MVSAGYTILVVKEISPSADVSPRMVVRDLFFHLPHKLLVGNLRSALTFRYFLRGPRR
jgi:hypothetical protein